MLLTRSRGREKRNLEGALEKEVDLRRQSPQTREALSHVEEKLSLLRLLQEFSCNRGPKGVRCSSGESIRYFKTYIHLSMNGSRNGREDMELKQITEWISKGPVSITSKKGLKMTEDETVSSTATPGRSGNYLFIQPSREREVG